MSGPPPSVEAKKALNHGEDEAKTWIKFWTDHRRPPTEQELRQSQPTDYVGIVRAGFDFAKGIKNPEAAVHDAIEEKGKEPTIDRTKKEMMAEDQTRKRPKYPCLHFKALIEDYEGERRPHLNPIGPLGLQPQRRPNQQQSSTAVGHQLDPEKSRSYSIGSGWQAIFDPRKALTFFIDPEGKLQIHPAFGANCLEWPSANEQDCRTYLIADCGGWKLKFDPVLGRSWYVDEKENGHLSDPMSYSVPEFALGQRK
jgi:hypothetical protein